MPKPDATPVPEPGWIAPRRERLLADLDVGQGRGIEIGALAMPLVRKGEADIRYVDWADRATLAAKYADDPNVPVANLVEVDRIWGDNTLAECFPDEPGFDYVVASHVIEHVPDMIGWLQEIAAVLRPGGRAYLAVPDKRYTFDHFRRTSSLAEFIGAYLTRSRKPTPGQIFDQGAYHSQLDPMTTWDKHPDPADHLDLAKLRQALAVATVVATQPQYLDIHCWTFTPRSMLDTLLALVELGLLPYRCHRFERTQPMENEMMIVLEKVAATDAASRQSFLDALERLKAADPETVAATDEPALRHALAPQRRPAENAGPPARPGLRSRLRRRAIALHWRLPRRAARTAPALRAEPQDLPALEDLGADFPPYQADFGPSPRLVDRAHRRLGAGVAPASLLRSDVPGFLRVADAQALYGFATYSKGDVLELGGSGPLPTTLLCQALRNRRSAARLVSIDSDPARLAGTRALLAERLLDRCFTGMAGEPAHLLPALTQQGRRFGFAFVDFAQSFAAVRPVCDLLTALMLPGGILLFHDFNDALNRTQPDRFGIYAAVRAYLADTAEIEFLGLVGCCAMLRKRR